MLAALCWQGHLNHFCAQIPVCLCSQHSAPCLCWLFRGLWSHLDLHLKNGKGLGTCILLVSGLMWTTWNTVFKVTERDTRPCHPAQRTQLDSPSLLGVSTRLTSLLPGQFLPGTLPNNLLSFGALSQHLVSGELNLKNGRAGTQTQLLQDGCSWLL